MSEKFPSRKPAIERSSKQAPTITRRSFLDIAGTSISAIVVLGISAVILKDKFDDDPSPPKAPEGSMDENLLRRIRKFASLQREGGAVPPTTVTIDLKSLKLDKLEWGNVSGMYLNQAAQPAEQIEVDFTASMNRLQHAKIRRLHKAQFESYTSFMLELESSVARHTQENVKSLVSQRRQKLIALLTPEQREDILKRSDLSEKAVFNALGQEGRQEYISYLHNRSAALLARIPKISREAFEADLHAKHKQDRFFKSVELLSSTLAKEYTDLYKEGSHEPTSLTQLQVDIDSICSDLSHSLDWKRIKDNWELNDDAIEILKTYAKKVNGSVLLACSMTELLPHDNGNINKKIYNTLAQHAGKAFLTRAPALGDNLPSFGPWQPTRYSINKAHKSSIDPLATKTSGASLVAPFVTSHAEPVPDTLEEVVTFEEHVRAAHLNAIFNLIACIRSLQKSSDHLQQLSTLTEAETAIFISVSHHRPSTSSKILTKYLSDRINYNAKLAAYEDKYARYVQEMKLGKKNVTEPIQPKSPAPLTAYYERAGKDLGLYARKTASNFASVAADTENQGTYGLGDFSD